MQVSITTESGLSTVKALLYAFPKKGNAPADYSLSVNGMMTEVAQTGGGKYPRYVYFKLNGVSYYLPKNVIPVSGTDIGVVAEAPKPVAAKEQPTSADLPAEAPPAEPVVTKKQRSPKAK